jgi:hypothetical protein
VIAALSRTNPHRRQTRRTALRPRCGRGRTQGRAEEARAIPPVAAESRRGRRAHRRVARRNNGAGPPRPARNCWSASSPNAAPAGKPGNSPSSRSKAKLRPRTGRRNTPSRCSRIPLIRIVRNCRRGGCGRDPRKERLSRVEDQEMAIGLSLKQSTAQRQNILRAAFAGQLVPQDPNDEPASVLLERIRKERAAQATPGKRTRRRQVEIA